jgi:hypothetical protein
VSALRPYWDAFLELTAARGASIAGSLPLAMCDIGAWLDMRDVPRSERGEWLDALLAMDVAWLAHVREQAEVED